MNTSNSSLIKKYLEKIYPEAKGSLDYFNDYSLLIAIVLSAQCTDKKVNIVTKKLFDKFRSLEELNMADLSLIEKEIMSLGIYKNKAKYIKGIAFDLLNKYNKVVPNNKKDLMSLPGVGNKTANVMMIEYFKVPEFPVDTHVNRISKRLAIANEDDNIKVVEAKLKKVFLKDEWIDMHHRMIYFGRNICKAQSPNCDVCELKNICKHFKKLHQ